MTQAIILAAGQGVRLRPYTDERPKCLVELGGRALLSWQIASLERNGVSDITVVGGYRHKQLLEFVTKVVVNEAYDRTNMVSSLFAADALVRAADDDLLIVYGDIVFEDHVVQAALSTDGDVAVVVDREWRRLWELRMEDPLLDAETLKLSPSGAIAELGRKPKHIGEIEGQYTGLIKVPAVRRVALSDYWRSLDRGGTYDGKSFDNMFMTSFIQSLIEANWRVMPAWITNGWLEVDTVADLDLFNMMYKDGSLDAVCRLR